VTIKDLAEKTGYSVATVSRVLNNHPNVSEKAREEINRMVAESGFQINANAQQLKQLHSSSILVVVKGTSNELFSELVEALQACMTQAEYPLIVDYLDENANEVLRAVQLCREKKPRGILFLGGNRQNFLEDFHKIDVPAVLITNDASGLPFGNLSSVAADDRAAARCAMETLIDLGHRKIAVIGGEIAVSDTSRLRYEGCLEALSARGVEFDEARDYRAVRFSYEGGYTAARDLLANGGEFTALFAFSDVMAIGAIRALWDAGKRVPEDISVVGFDGLPIGSYLVPQLTTIAQPVASMAEKGVQILLSAIESGANARYETVPFALCPRESTICL
jgi:LacI family transcriptional regulator